LSCFHFLYYSDVVIVTCWSSGDSSSIDAHSSFLSFPWNLIFELPTH